MADDADIANDIEAERVALILSRFKKSSDQASATECESCDSEIPEARRKALPGIQTCVHCAQLIEDEKAFSMGRLR
jgi:phage/conjugal plasmid C-4 type zinc finger TraR family protein